MSLFVAQNLILFSMVAILRQKEITISWGMVCKSIISIGLPSYKNTWNCLGSMDIFFLLA